MTLENFSNQNCGFLFVLSGPSGVGKGTVCRALRVLMPELKYSVSVTTRKPRFGEVEGKNYFFRTKEQFEEMIKEGKFIEWANYLGNYYGTPKEFVKKMLELRKDVLLEIEVKGALQVKSLFKNAVFIFLAPPSITDLGKRMRCRGTENAVLLSKRLGLAVSELQKISLYDYIVINDRVEKAALSIQAIITAEHCRIRDKIE